MSILDDAIREHLELKRAHGADEAEVKRLEDEAFGPPQRPDEPDPFAEAPTEFLVAPEVGAGEQAGRGAGRAARPQHRRPAGGARAAPAPSSPADEEQPGAEHEPIVDAGPSTEERHAIADQPTEMFDVEGQFEDAATEADAPSDEELVDAELAEPRLAPVDPLAGIEASARHRGSRRARRHEDEPADEFDEFFSEQRLSDELNQALEAPLPDEPGAPPTEEAPAVFVDLDDEEEDEARRRASFEDDEPDEEPSDEHELPGPRGAARARGQTRPPSPAASSLPPRGRARGHAGVPRGRARGRRALVRAEAAEGHRLRRLAGPRCVRRLNFRTRGHSSAGRARLCNPRSPVRSRLAPSQGCLLRSTDGRGSCVSGGAWLRRDPARPADEASCREAWRQARAIRPCPLVSVLVPADRPRRHRHEHRLGSSWGRGRSPRPARPRPDRRRVRALALDCAAVRPSRREPLRPGTRPGGLSQTGPYRHVRNPMIAAVLGVLASEAALFGSLPLLIWCAASSRLTTFLPPERGARPGAEVRRRIPPYERNVPRWLPRCTDPPQPQ